MKNYTNYVDDGALIKYERNGKQFKLIFYVARGNFDPLLSAETCLSG